MMSLKLSKAVNWTDYECRLAVAAHTAERFQDTPFCPMSMTTMRQYEPALHEAEVECWHELAGYLEQQTIIFVRNEKEVD